jgi:predicted secreted protein
MRTRVIPSLLLLGSLLLFSPAAASAKTVTLSGTSNGKTVHLRRGDTLKVGLRGESGSTGTSWSVTKRSAQSILKSKGSHYKADKLPPHYVGGGGTRTYRWKAVGAGVTSTTIKLFGPGDSRKAVKRYTLRISVT